MLLKKSEENIEVAELLYNEGKHNSVAHCAYYAFFQLMCYIDDNRTEIPEGKSSHDVIIKAFINDLKGDKKYQCIFGKIKPNIIQDRIFRIKALRTEADYSTTSLDQIKGQECIKESKSLSAIFKKIYKIKE